MPKKSETANKRSQDDKPEVIDESVATKPERRKGISSTTDEGSVVSPGAEQAGGAYGVEETPENDETSHPEENENDEEEADEAVPIAQAVEELTIGGDDANRVVAQEYDPEAKKPMYMRRRARLLAVIGCIAVILIGVGVAVGVLLSGGDNPQPPTQAPTSLEELEFRMLFSEQVSDRVFEEGSPHDLAAKWIMFQDPLGLSPDSPNLIQRYVLTLFYYMTTSNRETQWMSCNPSQAGEDSTCTFQSLARIGKDQSLAYVPFDGYTRWLSGASECNWAGVTCDSGSQVTVLRVWGHNMTGTLPSELSVLSSLQWLSLPFNEFTGQPPWSVLGRMELDQMELHFNQLVGAIPDSFWEQATTLRIFNLAENELTGTISTLLGRLTDLLGFFVFENDLSGPIPTEFGELTLLENTEIYANRFNGTIPTEVGRLTLVEDFWLHSNELSGAIPSEAGLMMSVVELFLDRNRLSGPIPEELYNATSLRQIFLDDQQLNGTLSTRIGGLVNLEELTLRGNELTGTIPSELGLLRGLGAAWLHLNLFSGSMPLEVCENVGPGRLEVLQTDCLPEVNPPVACDCCSSCCNRETEVCFIQEF